MQLLRFRLGSPWLGRSTWRQVVSKQTPSVAALLLAAGGLLCGLASCRPPAERTAAPLVPVRQPPPPAAVPPAPRAPAPPLGCPVNPPRVRDVSYNEIVRIGELGGRTWLWTYRSPGGPALSRLGDHGELVHTPLGLLPDLAAIEPPDRIRFLYTGDSPRLAFESRERQWWAVDVADPAKPRVGEPTPVPGLQPGELPRILASDGTSALITSSRLVGSQGVEELTALYEVPSGRRISPPAPIYAAQAHCQHKSCFALAIPNADKQELVLARIDQSGHHILEQLGRSLCPCPVDSVRRHCTSWQDGSVWILALSEGPLVRLWGVDLVTGQVRSARLEPGLGDCPRTTSARLNGRSGVVVWGAGRRAFYPVEVELKVGEPRPLPPAQHLTTTAVPLGHSSLWLEHDNAVSLGGAPSAGGQVHWHVWSFQGTASLLLPRQDGSFAYQDRAALPHDGERGSQGRGFDVLGLTAPGSALVLMWRRDTFGSSHEVLLRRPCSP